MARQLRNSSIVLAIAFLWILVTVNSSFENWASHGGDLLNRRYASKETKISPKTVQKMRLKWKFEAQRDITATPAIYDGIIYFPSWDGYVYAIKASSGSLVWKQFIQGLTGIPSPGIVASVNVTVARATPTVAPDLGLLLVGVYGPSYVLGLRIEDGSLVWMTRLDAHNDSVITMSGTYYNRAFYVGVSSLEEESSIEECCNFRGSFAKLDAKSGAILWKTYMLPNNNGQRGEYAGAAVWGSSPPIDIRRNLVFIATGNLYSAPQRIRDCQEKENNQTFPTNTSSCVEPENHSNSFLALELNNGNIKWYHQIGGYDVWFFACHNISSDPNCPPGPNPDADFGEAPMLLTLQVNTTYKKDVAVATQKSGFTWALDRDIGELFWSTVERERGITVKAQTTAMFYKHNPHVETDASTEDASSSSFLLNLIDTPGHVDFSYEVSRSLAACQGALLVVDAAQGVQAQTVANFYLAFESNLSIIPVINKIDQPTADPDRVMAQLKSMFDLDPKDALLTSAKTGQGLEHILPAVIERIPHPPGSTGPPLRMLLLDSYYDEYKGVICHVAIVDGTLRKGDKISSVATGQTYEASDIGIMHPELVPTGMLFTGQVGYVVSGMRSTKEARIGDTLFQARSVVEPLPGFKPARHMVFSGLYPADGSDFEALSHAIERLTCNDASVCVSKETSMALGLGFRCGFLGLLHMDVFHQRLEQEHGARIISTVPTVPYIFEYSDGSKIEVQNPASLLSDPKKRVTACWEPTVIATIIIPSILDLLCPFALIVGECSLSTPL